jgi:hypothetical protein
MSHRGLAVWTVSRADRRFQQVFLLEQPLPTTWNQIQPWTISRENCNRERLSSSQTSGRNGIDSRLSRGCANR